MNGCPSLQRQLHVEVLEPRDCPSGFTARDALLHEINLTKPIAEQINIHVVNHSPALSDDLADLSEASNRFLSGLAAATNLNWTSAEKDLVIYECLQSFKDADKQLSENVASDLEKFNAAFRSLFEPLQSTGGKRLEKHLDRYLQAFSDRVLALEHEDLRRADRLLVRQGKEQGAIVKDLVKS
ncbi:MAG: hypothetical protein K2R98_03600 [Gemmataceae bacterium]|nr:hypothetical protein [Gemmataceae bacterium]